MLNVMLGIVLWLLSPIIILAIGVIGASLVLIPVLLCIRILELCEVVYDKIRSKHG